MNEKERRWLVKPMLYFLTIFSSLELAMLTSVIGLSIFENEFHLDLNIPSTISGVRMCFFNDEDKNPECKEPRKINEICLGLLTLQLVLFIINALFKIAYFTRMWVSLLKVTKLLRRALWCGNNMTFFDDVYDLFKRIFPLYSFVPSDVIAGLTLSYIDARMKTESNLSESPATDHKGKVWSLIWFICLNVISYEIMSYYERQFSIK